jgi:hypothetical protein
MYVTHLNVRQRHWTWFEKYLLVFPEGLFVDVGLSHPQDFCLSTLLKIFYHLSKKKNLFGGSKQGDQIYLGKKHQMYPNTCL